MPGSPLIRNLSRAYLTDFRSTAAARIDSVDHWVFASQSVADYFMRVYEPSASRMEIIEHGSVIRLGRRRSEWVPVMSIAQVAMCGRLAAVRTS